jgi:hypothetical protein
VLPDFRRTVRAPLCALFLALFTTTPALAAWPPDGLRLGGPGIERFPIGLTGPDGGLWAFWVDRSSPTWTILTQRLTLAGEPAPGWPTAGRGIVGPLALPNTIHVVADGSGGALLAWFDHRPGGRGVYALRVDAEGAAMPGWSPDGSPVFAEYDSVGRGPLDQIHALAPDGAGGAFIAWLDTRGTPPGGTLVYDVYAQHMLGNGARDPAWPEDGLPLVTGPGFKYPHALVADDAGGFWLASEKAYDTSRLEVTHYGGDGDSLGAWSTPSFASRPVLAPDGTGGVFFAWRDCRDCMFVAPDAIYIQRLVRHAHPAVGWAAAGVSLGADEGDDNLPAIIATGDGAAMVAWRNDVTGGDESYRARRIEASGQFGLAWPSPTTFATIDVGFSGLLMVPDGAGGALFAFRRNLPNLFGSRVTAAGAVPAAFPDTGLALCAVSGAQFISSLVSDGLNGAYVLWDDHRHQPDDVLDVYVMRFTREGVVGSSSGVPPPPSGGSGHISLAPPVPNPASDVTAFTLVLTTSARVRMEVFDLTGRTVTLLFDGTMSEGRHTLSWDGRDSDGRAVPAGVYLVRTTSESDEVTQRVVRLR